jgi:hypothetical protein
LLWVVLLVDGVVDVAGVVLLVDGEVTAVASGEGVVAVGFAAAAVAGVMKVGVVEVEVDTTPTTRELPTLEEYIGVFCDV